MFHVFFVIDDCGVGGPLSEHMQRKKKYKIKFKSKKQKLIDLENELNNSHIRNFNENENRITNRNGNGNGDGNGYGNGNKEILRNDDSNRNNWNGITGLSSSLHKPFTRKLNETDEEFNFRIKMNNEEKLKTKKVLKSSKKKEKDDNK